MVLWLVNATTLVGGWGGGLQCFCIWAGFSPASEGGVGGHDDGDAIISS